MNKNMTSQEAIPPASRPILVMDLCTIGLIKERERIPLHTDERKKSRLSQIIKLAKSGKYRFSFLLAIIEKASDVEHPMNGQEMTERFIRDHEMISGLIGVENIVESTEMLKNIIPVYMSSEKGPEDRSELLLNSYLELLVFYDSLKVEAKPKKEDIISRVIKITDNAKVLGIAPGHPVVTICVAQVCGCNDAWLIVKKKRKKLFNPSNVLGDIQSFYRLAKVRSLVDKKYPGVDVIFRTEDEGLENMHEYYAFSHDIRTGELKAGISTKMMFPLLYGDDGSEDTDMLNKLYKMLDFKRS